MLGCRLGPGGAAGGAAARRCDRAAEAFHAGQAPRVLVCGGRRWPVRGVLLCEAAELRRALIERGVPAAAISRECRSMSTRENAENAARRLAEHGASRVGVVTCDWHQPRALRSFRRAGLEAVGIAAPSPPLGAGHRLLRALAERIATRCVW